MMNFRVEDDFIQSYFRSPGLFLDVGAGDGKTNSNIYPLLDRKWKGCGIEHDMIKFLHLLSTYNPFNAMYHEGRGLFPFKRTLGTETNKESVRLDHLVPLLPFSFYDFINISIPPPLGWKLLCQLPLFHMQPSLIAVRAEANEESRENLGKLLPKQYCKIVMQSYEYIFVTGNYD